MSILKSVIVVTLMSFAFSGTASEVGAPDDARSWLQKMSQAQHSLDYEGTFVYRSANHLQTMRIFHHADQDGERERLIALDGAPRQVIRDREKVLCILPDSDLVMVGERGSSPAFRFGFPAQLEQFDAHYTAEVGRGERVAGQSARKITLTPRDRYRYGHNLWLAENGLLLQAELIDDHGAVVEQVIFTELTLHESLPEALLQPDTEGMDVEWLNQRPSVSAGVANGVWRVGRLPPGFQQYAHRRRVTAVTNTSAEQLVFSDGLASVSVFIESDDSSGNFLGNSRKGPVNVFSRRLGGFRVTAVGEVPERTVRMVAESIVVEEQAND